jgi:hypothetical protein
MRTIRILALVVGLALLAVPSQATFTQQSALAIDSVFQGQVLVAMLQTAANIPSEAVTTVGHLQRAQFALLVLQNPTKWQPIVSMLIASQANNAMTPLTVPSTVADSLILTAMSAQWSNLSGYAAQ